MTPLPPSPEFDRRPSVRSRAISSALRLGVRPFKHHIPGHAPGIRTVRSTVNAGALNHAGAKCELQGWQGQMHVFQMLNRVLPEASAAMLEAARFVRTVAASPASAGRADTEAVA